MRVSRPFIGCDRQSTGIAWYSPDMQEIALAAIDGSEVSERSGSFSEPTSRAVHPAQAER